MGTRIELIGSFPSAKDLDLGMILPGGQTSPLLNYNPQGAEEYLIFGCEADNSATFILALTPDLKSELSGVLPESLGTDVFNITQTRKLQRGESHILEVRQTEDGPTRLIRLTHE